jgi:hypothetical protein
MGYDMQQKLPENILNSFMGCDETFNDITQKDQTNFYELQRYWFQSQKSLKILRMNSQLW